MNPQDLIIRRISLNRFVNERVVKYVTSHPILFARQRMADPLDDRPIRIKYFGVFQQKKTANKENIRKLNEALQLLRFNSEHYLELFQGMFSKIEEISLHMRNCFRTNNMEEFYATYEMIVNNKCKQSS